MQYSRLLSNLLCITILNLLVVSSRVCSAVARVLLCLSCLCWCSRQTHCFQKFSLEIHCRKVSNAEASQLKERVNWKAFRVTSGAAYFCEVRISGIVDQVGTLLSGVVDQVGNLELSCCGPGWEPGALVVSILFSVER